jgi:PKD repeat protein
VTPTSGFRYKNAAKPGTTFQFTDGSTNMTSGCEPIWSWNFGDGSGTSSLQNPSYLYVSSNSTPGFTVSLTASNSAGSSTTTVVLRVDNP